MSSEIATWGMIRSKVPAFPAPTAGRENECLTKSEIVSLGSGNVHVEGSYGDGECVMVDNVLPVIWEYTFIVTPTSLSFGSTGGTQSVSVTSYKRKYFGSNYTGEQVDVGFSSSASGNGFSSAGTSVSIGNNTTTSNRTGNALFTQAESGKTVPVYLIQLAGTMTYEYTISVMPGIALTWKSGDTSTKILSVTALRVQKVNGVVVYSEQVPWDFELDFEASMGLGFIRIGDNELHLTPNSANTIFKGNIKFWVVASSGVYAMRAVRRV